VIWHTELFEHLALGDLLGMNCAKLICFLGRPPASTLHAIVVALSLQLFTLHGA
jgi:hypothetical protein